MSFDLRWGAAVMVSGVWVALSCGNPDSAIRRDGPSSGGNGAGATAGVGVGGSLVASGGSGGSLIITGGGPGEGGAPPGCYMYELNWEPQIPTVEILVDRSSSMTEYGLWTPIRDAILPVVQQLEADVRFGFTAYTASDGVGCPANVMQLDSVPIALNNYAAIQPVYALLEPPNKSETPTGPAIDFARDQLLADTTAGAKFLLLVTDGQPDYCDNPNARCPTDAVIGKIQQLNAGGIRTLVFGFEGINSNDAAQVAGLTWALQSFANAGSGQPVGVGPGMTRVQEGVPLTPGAVVFWDECGGYMPWRTEHDALGLQQWYPIGTYAAPAGTATVYKPNPTDAAALANEFGSVLAAVKSCTFDLAAEVEAGTLKIDLTRLDLVNVGIVDVNGATTQVSLDQTGGQGWRMASDTQLVFEGAACDQWRSRDSRQVAFDFPCDVIIVIPPQ